jgi:hypothetical protein
MHASFRAGFEKSATVASPKTASIITTMNAPVLKGQRAIVGQASKATKLSQTPTVRPPTGAPANVNPSVARG